MLSRGVWHVFVFLEDLLAHYHDSGEYVGVLERWIVTECNGAISTTPEQPTNHPISVISQWWARIWTDFGSFWPKLKNVAVHGSRWDVGTGGMEISPIKSWGPTLGPHRKTIFRRLARLVISGACLTCDTFFLSKKKWIVVTTLTLIFKQGGGISNFCMKFL